MFKIYRCSKISTKLYIGFLAIIFLSLIVFVSSIASFKKGSTTFQHIVKFELEDVLNTHQETYFLMNMRKSASELLLNYNTHDDIENFFGVLIESKEKLIQLAENNIILIEEKEKLNKANYSHIINKQKEIIKYTNEYYEIASKLHETVLIGNIPLAREQDEAVSEIGRKLVTIIETSTDNAVFDIKNATTELTNSNNFMIYVIILLSFIIVISSLVISIITEKSINNPINEISKASEDICKGNLNVNLPTDYKGAVGVLSDNMKNVIFVINNLIYEINKMSSEMQAGKLSSRVDGSKFEGSYRDMSIAINSNLDSLILDINMFTQISQKYSSGDFSQKMSKMPQEKAIFNVTLDTLENNLKNISYDIKHLVVLASDGNFDEKVSSDKYSGIWKEIINDMNSLLDNIKDPLSESISVLNEVSKGNLSVTIKGNYKGDYKLITQTVNSTITTLNELIDEIGIVVGRISNKDLTATFSKDYNGDFSKIKNSVEKSISVFISIINDISSSSNHIVDGVNTITSSTLVLAEAANNQNNIIEKLNSSMNSLSSEAKNNKSISNEVVELTKSASSNAFMGNDYMNNMLSSMSEIENSTNKILNIIKVIDDIAFQTNLLALNAAVEAARAGEHGKGFSIVAEEVRSLASRSKNAAKETEGIINNTVSKVRSGSSLAHQTAETLHKIVDQISIVSEKIVSVSSSSESQVEFINRNNFDIDELVKIAQTNTSISQESASIAEELSSQSETFKTMISEFKTII